MKKIYQLLVLFFLSASITKVPAQTPCSNYNSPANLVVNGSFEDDLNTGWNWSGGELEALSDYVVCGAYNGSLGFIGGTEARAWQEIPGLPAGASLSLTCHLGIFELGQVCSPKIHLSFYNSARVLISRTSKDITNNVELPPHELSEYTLQAVVPLGTAITCIEVTTECDRVKMEAFSLEMTSFVLPVRLSQFSGLLRNAGSELNWVTTSEENVAKFDIEYSTNGAQFATIGSVSSRGNSSTPVAYQFRHTLPVPGKNYYRLRITDRNGQFTYSGVAVIDAPAAALSGIRLSPNPFAGNLEFRLYSVTPQTLLVRLVNQQGKVVVQQKYSAQKGSQLFTLNHLGNLPAGLYMAEVVNGKGERLLSTRVVK